MMKSLSGIQEIEAQIMCPDHREAPEVHLESVEERLDREVSLDLDRAKEALVDLGYEGFAKVNPDLLWCDWKSQSDQVEARYYINASLTQSNAGRIKEGLIKSINAKREQLSELNTKVEVTKDNVGGLLRRYAYLSRLEAEEKAKGSGFKQAMYGLDKFLSEVDRYGFEFGFVVAAFRKGSNILTSFGLLPGSHEAMVYQEMVHIIEKDNLCHDQGWKNIQGAQRFAILKKVLPLLLSFVGARLALRFYVKGDPVFSPLNLNIEEYLSMLGNEGEAAEGSLRKMAAKLVKLDPDRPRDPWKRSVLQLETENQHLSGEINQARERMGELDAVSRRLAREWPKSRVKAAEKIEDEKLKSMQQPSMMSGLLSLGLGFGVGTAFFELALFIISWRGYVPRLTQMREAAQAEARQRLSALLPGQNCQARQVSPSLQTPYSFVVRHGAEGITVIENPPNLFQELAQSGLEKLRQGVKFFQGINAMFPKVTEASSSSPQASQTDPLTYSHRLAFGLDPDLPKDILFSTGGSQNKPEPQVKPAPSDVDTTISQEESAWWAWGDWRGDLVFTVFNGTAVIVAGQAFGKSLALAATPAVAEFAKPAADAVFKYSGSAAASLLLWFGAPILKEPSARLDYAPEDA